MIVVCPSIRRSAFPTVSLLLLFSWQAAGQTDPRQIGPLLDPVIQTTDATALEMQRYLAARVPDLRVPSTAEEFTREANRLRRHLLDDVVLHGWPKEWVEAPLKVEDLGLLPSGKHYRMRKLRFEVFPGFQTTGILYEPETVKGRIPAILNVHGHVGAEGNAIEYKQKRCINQALQGIFALSLEWLGSGELNQGENQHWYAAHLDLVGANGVGIFYLTMRKGLDYLYQHPAVDPSRIGMTGLSGGGWQTILLSALDERVFAAAPAAGYAPYRYRLARIQEAGDIEQNPTDMFRGIDYTHLTTLRAPRPTLLIYNAEDNCCWRAPLVKPELFDPVAPIFRLYGGEDRFAWHENLDPADHNYQLDNRLRAYRFFSRSFGLPEVTEEIPVDAQIKSPEELRVGLPAGNATLLTLARRLAQRIERVPIPTEDGERAAWADGQRKRLAETVRFPQLTVSHAWGIGSTKHSGLETISYRFQFSNGLTATAVRLKALTTPDSAPVTIILNDKGKKASAAEVSQRVNRGEIVLAADLLFIGDMAPASRPGPGGYAQLLATFGERALSLEAAQLVTLSRWLSERSQTRTVRLESTGIRSQVLSLVATALHPRLFSDVVIRDGIPTLGRLLDAPTEHRAAPELFCLNLYRDFDIDRLIAIGAPARISSR
jgi:dienelactone hydrolase